MLIASQLRRRAGLTWIAYPVGPPGAAGRGTSPLSLHRPSALKRPGSQFIISLPVTLAKRGFPTMTNDALRTILPIAGWDEERARAVDITGGTDPILPT